jgi:hypothetical protein
MLIIINSIINNIYNPMVNKDKSRNESLVNNYNNFKIHKNLILYLQKIGNIYPGKNVKLLFCNFFFSVLSSILCIYIIILFY